MAFTAEHYFFIALLIAGVCGLSWAFSRRKKPCSFLVVFFLFISFLGVMGPNWLFNLPPTPYAIAYSLNFADADDSAESDIAADSAAADSAVSDTEPSVISSATPISDVAGSVSITETSDKTSTDVSSDYQVVFTPGKSGAFQWDDLKLTQSSQDVAVVSMPLEPPASGKKSTVVVEGTQEAQADVARIAYSYDLYGVVEITLKNGEKGYAAILFLKAENTGSKPTGAIAVQQELPAELAQSVDDVLGCSVECTVTKGSVLVTLFFDGIQPGEEKTASVTVKVDSPLLNKGDVLGRFKQPVAVSSNQGVQLVESKGPNTTLAILGLVAVLAIAALVTRFFMGRQ